MKRLVIIGGGFAGSYIAKELQNEYKITLIDRKNYFEFTPGVPRTLTQPEHAKAIQISHRKYLKNVDIEVKEVRKIGRNYVFAGKKKINFDYLVICTGSEYHSPFKEKNMIISARSKELLEKNKELLKAKNIMIVGGGLVGVEIAGEIIQRCKGKKITIVHAHDTLLERNNYRSQKHAERFLKRNGVNIIYGEKIVKNKGKIFFSDKGRVFTPDLVLICTGISPNYYLIQNSFKNSLDEKKFFKINSFLQFDDYDNIFAAGDITNFREEKTAQNAQRQAKIVVKNLKREKLGKPLVKYNSTKTPLVISLGSYDGIFEYKNFVITGLIPGILKLIIERREMLRRNLGF